MILNNKPFTLLSIFLGVVSLIVFLVKVEFNVPGSSIAWCGIMLMLALLAVGILASYLTGFSLHRRKVTVITGICIAISAVVIIYNTAATWFCVFILTL